MNRFRRCRNGKHIFLLIYVVSEYICVCVRSTLFVHLLCSWILNYKDFSDFSRFSWLDLCLWVSSEQWEDERMLEGSIQKKKFKKKECRWALVTSRTIATRVRMDYPSGEIKRTVVVMRCLLTTIRIAEIRSQEIADRYVVRTKRFAIKLKHQTTTEHVIRWRKQQQ